MSLSFAPGAFGHRARVEPIAVRVTPRLVVGCAVLVDLACILLSVVLAASLAGEPFRWQGAVIVGSIAAVFGVGLLHLAAVYQPLLLARPSRALPLVALAAGATVLALCGAVRLWGSVLVVDHCIAPDAVSAGALAAGMTALLLAARTLIARLTRQWAREGRLRETIAIVGTGPAIQGLLWRLFQIGSRPFEIAGIYDCRSPMAGQRYLGHDIGGRIEDLLRDARGQPIDAVIVALPIEADLLLRETVSKLSVLNVEVRIYTSAHALGPRAGGASVLALPTLVEPPLRSWRAIVKNAEDRILAAFILVLISPLLLAIAVLIRLDSPGPILFRQKRLGLDNRLIEVWKFRTMHHAFADADAEIQTRRNDPRVTRIGMFLRRNSLDELPQFFNVLSGDMSVVGPRPHAISTKAGALLFHEAVKNYHARHRVKPGITGWAQVNGWRGETSTIEQLRKRVEHDLYYIANWSVAFDLVIILRTVLGGFRSRNAY